MSPIVRGFGMYLDLRKVVSIGFARLYEHHGRGGYGAQVGFDIRVQRMKAPIEFRRNLVDGVEIRRNAAKGWDVDAYEFAIAYPNTIGTPTWLPATGINRLTPPCDAVAVLRLQREIDEIIVDPWHELADVRG